jgi:prevent-host-death family protein
MKKVSVSDLRNHLRSLLADVAKGEELEVCKHNRPFARIVATTAKPRNRTKPGCGRGTCRILGDLTEPLIPESNWEMLR